jgi:hypothetical protein
MGRDGDEKTHQYIQRFNRSQTQIDRSLGPAYVKPLDDSVISSSSLLFLCIDFSCRRRVNI